MRKRIVTSIVFVFLAAGLAYPQTAPKAGIRVVGMTPYDLTQLYGSKGSSMYPSTGLKTVGEKTIVYLQAIDSTGGTIQSAKWSVIDPPGGSAQVDSATPFTTIELDTTGQYTVEVTITVGGVTSSSSVVLTSADYVGVGSMGIVTNDSATASTPECGTCHQGALTGLGLDPTADYAHWMNTEHASFFKLSINGHNPEGQAYSAHCIQCHTTGYNPTAANGNFAAVANQVGWTFPDTLVDTNFAHLYHMSPHLAQLATIGCESCHGPGSEHWGDASKISVSLKASDCMQCHDEPPHHAIGREWVSSPHDSGMIAIQAMEGGHVLSAPCAQCHTVAGFVDYSINGKLEQSKYNAMPLTCAGCHNPHDADNPFQLRKYSAPPLENGFKITTGGAGQLCMNCHRSRSDANAAVDAGWKPYFGPHEGPQTDVFFGQDGYTFGDSSLTGLTTHTQLTNSCVTCHMAADTVDPNAAMTLGGHTWKMVGPDSKGDTTENTTACQSCHGPITNFDQIAAPYDYAGIAHGGPIPGVQTEVKALLAKLKSYIPDSVLANPGSATVGKNLTRNQLGAVWDYLLFSKDGSYGVHNAKYTFALLERAIGAFTGTEVVSSKVPRTFALEQNYPNPFNPTTTIEFSVPKTGVVNVAVYNSIGQLVKTLTNENYVPGTYRITWNGRNNAGVGVASGVYFYKLTTKSYVRTMKMMLLK